SPALGPPPPAPTPPPRIRQPLGQQPGHLLIPLTKEQAHRQHVIDHHPGRQQPAAPLHPPGLSNHPVHQLRRERRRQKPDRDPVRQPFIRRRLHLSSPRDTGTLPASQPLKSGVLRLDQPGHDDHPLFYGQHRAKLSRGGIAWIIRKYHAHANDPPAGVGISPHILRHSKAMHLYEAGVPLPYIRDILGHVDLSTTEIYARASTEAKRKALEAAYRDIVTSDLPEWNQDPGLPDWPASL